jgi:hypothetical protein
LDLVVLVDLVVAGLVVLIFELVRVVGEVLLNVRDVLVVELDRRVLLLVFLDILEEFDSLRVE